MDGGCLAPGVLAEDRHRLGIEQLSGLNRDQVQDPIQGLFRVESGQDIRQAFCYPATLFSLLPSFLFLSSGRVSSVFGRTQCVLSSLALTNITKNNLHCRFTPIISCNSCHFHVQM